MNAPLTPVLQQVHAVAEAVAEACRRIAPTWPLDRLIAVNPHWGWVDRPIEQAGAALGQLSGARLLMPLAWYRQAWRDGQLRREHLAAVAPADVERLQALLESDIAELSGPTPLPCVVDLRTPAVGAGPLPGVREAMVHQVSQHCAAWFDTGQAQWGPGREQGLLGSWREQLAEDRGLAWRHGRRWLRARLAAMPAEPVPLIGAALQALALPAAGRAPYLTALLLGVNGWAAWCAHERWQAGLRGAEDDSLVELLAILVAWEWLLADDGDGVPPDWARAWADAEPAIARLQARQADLWALQAAVEHAYQDPLRRRLARPVAAPATPPEVQAVFCIDVRSERLRRALETVAPAVSTRGFAGFFGLPVAYTPLGTALQRPQLPGLLAPSAQVVDAPTDGDGIALAQALVARRRAALGWQQSWDALRRAPGSAFSFVETCGLLYAARLLRDGGASAPAEPAWAAAGLPAADQARLRPRLAGLDAGAAATLAAGILRAMGLTGGFAPLVLLVGHGSTSANNPHAAGLDCGACGGQTGEVNARALAGLLNDPEVRGRLAVEGIAIPPGTHFVPALHDTTTDAVALFDTDALPAAAAPALERLRHGLREAGALTRAERAPALGETARGQDALSAALHRRAADWAQTRPEWGLADNAAFIVAPRARTLGLDLEGRCFLHDYDWRNDTGGSVLELIMTAPMVVTHWINLQYHASTVDPQRYGSGNKLLHNVVGGGLGVFEGNGGDLRIGLPWQSVHDGRRWRHTPLRLSVFIEAPTDRIDAVIARHATVRHLVEHRWLHLFAIEAQVGAPASVRRRSTDGWVACEP